jgi:hypothetical protein
MTWTPCLRNTSEPDRPLAAGSLLASLGPSAEQWQLELQPQILRFAKDDNQKGEDKDKGNRGSFDCGARLEHQQFPRDVDAVGRASGPSSPQ